MQLFDAHMHAHIQNAQGDTAALAQEIEKYGLGLFSCGLNPKDWEDDCALMAQVDAITVGAGLHPWLVGTDDTQLSRCGDAEADLLERICWETPYIGEIGLDFGKRSNAAQRELQLAYFERICRSAAAASRETAVARILSIHSVAAADVVLDVLERTDALTNCACIFHWFSGSADTLWRAIHSGCWFSMNHMGLKTGKGREYAKLIPEQRLLTESDYELALDAPDNIDKIAAALDSALELLAQARTEDKEKLREHTVGNIRKLFPNFRTL